MSEERTHPPDPADPVAGLGPEAQAGSDISPGSPASPAVPASIDEPSRLPSQTVAGETASSGTPELDPETKLDSETKLGPETKLDPEELVLYESWAADRNAPLDPLTEEPVRRMPAASVPAASLPHEERQGKRRRASLIKPIAAAIIAAALVLLVVRALSNTYYIYRCGAENITAESGRTLSPWGTRQLSGPEWAPIRIPKSIRCESQRLETREELLAKYRETLIQQAEAWVVDSRPYGRDIDHMAEVKAQLDQALLLSRDAASDEVRRRIDRLLADLEYWQARGELDAAALRLETAAKQFGEAARRQPMHNQDAAAWQSLSDKVAEMLDKGPSALSDIAAPRAPEPSLRSELAEPDAGGHSMKPAENPATPVADAGTGSAGNPATSEQPGPHTDPAPQPGEAQAPAAEVPPAPPEPTKGADSPSQAPKTAPDGASRPRAREQAPPDAGIPRGGELI